MTEVWKYSAATGGSLLVLLCLADHANVERRSCWPSLETIAQRSRLTVRQVRRILRWLEEIGEITTVPGGGRRRTNLYVIADLNPDISSGVETRTFATGNPDICDQTRTFATGKPDTGVLRTINEPSKEPSGEPSPRSRAPGSFTDFFETYPRKANRAGAERAWKTATRKTSAEKIIAGAQRYRDDPNRVDQFTKFPTTWLDQGCWDDDPLPARGRGRSESRATQVMNTAAAWAQREEAKQREAETRQCEPPNDDDDVIVDGEIVGGENDPW